MSRRGSAAAALLPAAVLLLAARGAVAGPRAVRADVVVTYERAGDGPAGGERAAIEGYLVAARPDRLRLSTHFGFLKAFDLTAGQDSFWVAVPRYHAVLAGRKDQVRIVPLDPGRLSQALFLDPRGAGRPDSADTVADSLGARVSGRDSLGDFQLALDREGEPLRLVRRRDDGTPFLDIEFERYATVEGGRYPRRIRWRDLEGRQSLVMDFDNIVVDGEAPSTGFGAPADPDLKVVPWSSWEAVFTARSR